MNKTEFVSRVTKNLRDLDMRKPVHIKKRQFYIRDADGQEAKFDVKPEDKEVTYTVEDVTAILDSCLAVATDAIKNGEEVSLIGFGTLGLKRQIGRRVRHPNTGEWVDIKEGYIPKFKYGNTLAIAARLYGLSLLERPEPEPEPIYEEDL